MKRKAKPVDPQSVFCDVCLKRVPKSSALMSDAPEGTVYFCSAGCYQRWHQRHPPAPAPRDIQEGAELERS